MSEKDQADQQAEGDQEEPEEQGPEETADDNGLSDGEGASIAWDYAQQPLVGSLNSAYSAMMKANQAYIEAKPKGISLESHANNLQQSIDAWDRAWLELKSKQIEIDSEKLTPIEQAAYDAWESYSKARTSGEPEAHVIELGRHARETLKSVRLNSNIKTAFDSGLTAWEAGRTAGGARTVNDLFSGVGGGPLVFEAPGGTQDTSLDTGHYDDGHTFDWKPGQTQDPPITPQIDLIPDIAEPVPEGSSTDGGSFGWKKPVIAIASVGAAAAIGLGVILAVNSGGSSDTTSNVEVAQSGGTSSDGGNVAAGGRVLNTGGYSGSTAVRLDVYGHSQFIGPMPNTADVSLTRNVDTSVITLIISGPAPFPSITSLGNYNVDTGAFQGEGRGTFTSSQRAGTVLIEGTLINGRLQAIMTINGMPNGPISYNIDMTKVSGP